MARLSMNEVTTFRWSFEEDVAQYKTHGIPAISVWRQKLADFGEEKGAELLAESGLSVTGLLWAGGFTGSCGRTFRDCLDDAIEAVRLAEMLRASCLVVYSGGRGGHTTNHARRLLVQALRELAPLASECGVRLAVEPMHPNSAAEWTFLTSLDETVEVLEQIGVPSLGIVLDLYHWGWDHGGPRRIGKFVDHLALVQLGDSKAPPDREQNRCPLGEGAVPLKEWVTALTKAGYDGDYDVELLGEDIDPHCYEDVLERSKQVFNRLLSDATA